MFLLKTLGKMGSVCLALGVEVHHPVSTRDVRINPVVSLPSPALTTWRKSDFTWVLQLSQCSHAWDLMKCNWYQKKQEDLLLEDIMKKCCKYCCTIEQKWGFKKVSSFFWLTLYWRTCSFTVHWLYISFATKKYPFYWFNYYETSRVCYTVIFKTYT